MQYNEMTKIKLLKEITILQRRISDLENNPAEQLLREGERKYRNIIETMNEGLIAVNQDDKIYYVNKSACKILGYKQDNDDIIGVSARDLVDPDYLETYDKQIEERNGGVEHSAYELTLRSKENQKIPVLISGRAIHDEQGNVSGRFAVISDLTERKRLESNQSQLLRRNKSLLEALGEIVYEDYVQKNKRIWSGDYFRVLGYSEAEMGNDSKSWTDKIHPVDLKKALDELDNSITEKRNYDVEYRVRCRDGSYRWMYDRGIFHFNEKGQADQLIGILLDISERKKLDNQFRLLGSVLEEANCGIAMADLDENLAYVNKYFAHVHGYEPDELHGKKILMLHSTHQLEAANKLLQQLKVQGYFSPVEVWHKHKSGRDFPMLMTGRVFKDSTVISLSQAAFLVEPLSLRSFCFC